jgi:5-methylthioadenosine/S-adenosylhomocysteine deaminase
MRRLIPASALVALSGALFGGCSSDSGGRGGDISTGGQPAGGNAGLSGGRCAALGCSGGGGTAGNGGAPVASGDGGMGGDVAGAAAGGVGGVSDTGDAGASGDAGSAGVASAAGASAGDASGGMSSNAGTGGIEATGGSTNGAGGTGGNGGGAGGASGCVSAMGAAVTTAGVAGRVLLKGTVVTPDQVLQGEVLIEGDTITCVGVSCAGTSGATTAAVVDTHGIILPGLIDTHNHILFDIFDENDWAPRMSYQNHNQWPSEARYAALTDAKAYLNGETTTSPYDLGCELDKYGEIKGLIAGTTSIVGAAVPANRRCYGSLARTIDQTPNGLTDDRVQVATLFPATSAADTACANLTSGATDGYLIHVAEGVNDTVRKEFGTLGTISTTDNCLYSPKTTIVHGTDLSDAEFTIMGTAGMSLVWSPRSDVFLYGGGTDLLATTNIPLALSKGINVAIGPNWSIGGSTNLLEELRFAHETDKALWGNQLTPKMLVQMATTNAAKALGLGAVLGSLEVGKKADITVLSGDTCSPYDAIVRATPSDVRMVFVGGTLLYGDPGVQSLAPATPGCEALSVCGSNKFICAATATATDKLGQAFAQIQSNLTTALSEYDALNLSQWDFSPLAPIVKCQ